MDRWGFSYIVKLIFILDDNIIFLKSIWENWVYKINKF